MKKHGCIVIVHSLYMKGPSVHVNTQHITDILSCYAGPFEWRIENPHTLSPGPSQQQAVQLQALLEPQCQPLRVVQSSSRLLREEHRTSGGLATYASIAYQKVAERNLMIVAAHVNWHHVVDEVLSTLLQKTYVSGIQLSPKTAGSAAVIADFTVERFVQCGTQPNPPRPYDHLVDFLQ